jgi:hypothetical protein
MHPKGVYLVEAPPQPIKIKKKKTDFVVAVISMVLHQPKSPAEIG